VITATDMPKEPARRGLGRVEVRMRVLGLSLARVRPRMRPALAKNTTATALEASAKRSLIPRGIKVTTPARHIHSNRTSTHDRFRLSALRGTSVRAKRARRSSSQTKLSGGCRQDLRRRLARISCMRSFGGSALAVAAAAAVSLLFAPEAPAAASCAARTPVAAPRLPAPVVVTTDCGRYRFDGRGHVSFRRGFALPVPVGTTGYYADLNWYRVSAGHLTIGHAKRALWHSRGRFARYGDMGVAVSDRAAIAFSTFHGRRQSLFVARLGQAERLVASGETPLGFTRAGALISDRRWTLPLRRGPDWQVRTIARGASDVVFDHTTDSVYFVAHGRLMRFDGARVTQLATLAALGLGRRPEIEPLGRLVGLHSAQRLVVLRDDGRLVAATPLPRPLKRADVVSSALAAIADAVAFTVSRSNTAYGSSGSELVYLLRRGREGRGSSTASGCRTPSASAWPACPGAAAGCSTRPARGARR
jgi:hypothetical protein